MDTFDRVQRDDMIQQATVVAVFAYNAAMRDESCRGSRCPRQRRRQQVAARTDRSARDWRLGAYQLA